MIVCQTELYRNGQDGRVYEQECTHAGASCFYRSVDILIFGKDFSEDELIQLNHRPESFSQQAVEGPFNQGEQGC